MQSIENILDQEEKIVLQGERSGSDATGGTIALERSEAGQGDPPRGRNIFPKNSDPRRIGRKHRITGRDAIGFIVDDFDSISTLATPEAPRRNLRAEIQGVLADADYKAKMARALALAAQEFA